MAGLLLAVSAVRADETVSDGTASVSAIDDLVVMNQNATSTLNVLDNDSTTFSGGAIAACQFASFPTDGTSSGGFDGLFSYTPDVPAFSGLDQFGYRMTYDTPANVSSGPGPCDDPAAYAQAVATGQVFVLVNAPPVVAAGLADQSAVRDANLEIDLAGAFTDPDLGVTGDFRGTPFADALTYTITGGAASPVLDSAVIAGETLSVDLAAGGGPASVTLTIRATDNRLTSFPDGGDIRNSVSGNFVETSFTITIDANAAPVANGIADIEIDEDEAPPTVVDLSGAFSDANVPAADSLTLSVVGSTAPGLFADVSLTGTDLTIDPAADQNGSATITIRATDTGG
ncbi:MAG: Ig-like domain-containing protein, partial [Pseudomonadales bacterium]|nr:Ig-like domain-containing protein [Pseudomonadales bacterium]